MFNPNTHTVYIVHLQSQEYIDWDLQSSLPVGLADVLPGCVPAKILDFNRVANPLP